MRRLLLIPAAGRGSRLLSSLPKALVPVNGRPMIDRLFAMYRDHVEKTVVVASPGNAVAIAEHCRTLDPSPRVAIQREPTGMLDALLAALDEVRSTRPDRVWVTWCDQVAIHPRTIERLASIEGDHPDAALVFPTVHRAVPYIHFDRGRSGRITGVRQRREGDTMPADGESDAGLFALAFSTFAALASFASETAPGERTGEANFLPLIPVIARREPVITFECTDVREAVGINTREELVQVEAYLRGRKDV